MNDIICISPQGWSDTPARTQQLLSRIRDTQILFFAPEHGQHYPSGKRVRPNITIYTLPRFPLSKMFHHPKLQSMEQKYLANFILKKSKKHHFRKPILWTTSPQQVHLLEHLRYDLLVYDCSQEWDALPPQWEGRLAHSADVIFVASKGLQERLSPCNHNITLIQNGVNFPLFFDLPSPTAHTPPSFGWVGNINWDLDLSPLIYTARAMPEWKFILIGNISPKNPYITKLKKLPNIKFLGVQPLSEVPNYLSQCHVLLNFNQTSDAGSDIIPIRLYQYLSTGRPIVSMLLPEQIEQFPDVVYDAYDNKVFLHLCESALTESPSWVTEHRQNYGKSANWAKRTKHILDILKLTGFV